MSQTRVSTTVSAPVRTLGQLGAAAVIIEFVAAFFATDWTQRQYGAALAVATLVVTGVQHFIENRTGHALLRQVPPVYDDRGDMMLEYIGRVLLIVGVALLLSVWAGLVASNVLVLSIVLAVVGLGLVLFT